MCKWLFSLVCFRRDKIFFGSSDFATRDNIVLKGEQKLKIYMNCSLKLITIYIQQVNNSPMQIGSTSCILTAYCDFSLMTCARHFWSIQALLNSRYENWILFSFVFTLLKNILYAISYLVSFCSHQVFWPPYLTGPLKLERLVWGGDPIPMPAEIGFSLRRGRGGSSSCMWGVQTHRGPPLF